MAPGNDEAKKHNEQLPGMGGVFNVVNFQLYHYAGNNPVKYIDPTGESNTIKIMVVGFFHGEGTSTPHNFGGKLLLIMHQNSDGGLNIIATDKREEIEAVKQERSKIMDEQSQNSITTRRLSPNEVDITNIPVDQANIIKKEGGTLFVKNTADSIYGKNNDNEVYYVSDLLYIELSITYNEKTGQTENAEVIQTKKYTEGQ